MKTRSAENRVVAAVTVLVLLIGAAAFVWRGYAVGLFGDSGDGVVPRTEALIGAFMRGDRDALDTLAPPSPEDDRGALTRAGAAVAMGKDPSFTVHRDRVDGSKNASTVPATLHTPAGNVELTLSWTRSNVDAQWVLTPIKLPRLAISTAYTRGAQQAQSFAVNGQHVSIPFAGIYGPSVPVWPGAAEVTFGRDGLFAWAPNEDPELAIREPLGQSSTAPVTTLTVVRTFDDTSSKEAAELVTAYLKTCADAQPSRDADCPFAPPATHDGGVTPRAVKFGDPDLGAEPVFSDEGAVTLAGTVSVTASWKHGDTWKTSRTSVPFSVNGFAVTSGGTSRFELTYASRMAVQDAWTDAANDIKGSS